MLLVRAGAAPERLLLPCRNIQDELHAQGSRRHPRDARTAYFIDPKDLLAIGRREGAGLRGRDHLPLAHRRRRLLLATDRQNALIDGEPAYPDATYVVLSVRRARRGRDAAAFVWDAAARDFVAIELHEALTDP